MRSLEISLRLTSRPATAQTCAMPLPIWPAPITPTLRISALLPSPNLRDRAHHKQYCTAVKAAGSTAGLLKFLVEFRQHFEKVADNPVIGNLEDRRLLVLVDGDDDLRVLHACEVLDRPGNADGDVE